MKKLLRILGVFLLLVLLALILIPVLFKDRIVEEVKAVANDNLNATLDFDDAGLTFFADFPNLTLTLDALHLANHAPFEGVDLVKADQVTATVNLGSLFGDAIEVVSVELDRPVVDVRVLEDGSANYDIAVASEEGADESSSEEVEEPSAFALNLNHYAIQGGHVRYDDATMPFLLDIEDLNHEGNGDFTLDQFVLDTKTTAAATTVDYDGVKYLSALPLDLDAQLDINLAESTYTFKENTLKAGDFPLHAEGYVAMPGEDINMDIDFTAPGSDFKTLLSLVPADFAHDLAGVQASGKVAFDGKVAGTYNESSLPGMVLNLNVAGGGFHYTDLPEGAENINIDLHVDASEGVGSDATTVDLNTFHAELAGNPVDAELHLKTPMSDPGVAAALKGLVDLGTLAQVVPLEPGTDLRGRIDADVNLAGNLSSIEQERYQDFDARGVVEITDLRYQLDSTGTAADIGTMKLVFSPQYLALEAFEALYAESDVQAEGRIDNYLAWALQDSTLAGQFTVNSHLLDLNPFMTASEAAPSDSAAIATTDAEAEPMGVLEIPENIDFRLTAYVDELLYDDIGVSQLRGVVALDRGTAGIRNTQMRVLNGQVLMDGAYSTASGEPVVDMDFDIVDMDIQQAAETFYTIEKMAPLAKSCKGDFSSQMHMNAVLDGNMEPVEESLDVTGRVQVDEVFIEKFEPLNKIASELGIDRLAKQRYEDLNIGYKVENGLVIVEPFEVKMDGIPATIGGSMTFEQALDYTVDMDVPADRLPGNLAGRGSGLLDRINDQYGTNLSASSTIPVKLRIGGTVQKPEVLGGTGDAVKETTQDLKEQAVDAAKEAVQEAVDQAKEDAVAQAREEADRILADAQKQADKLVADATKTANDLHKKAYDEAQKVEDSYKNPLEKAAKRLAAQKLRDKADDARDAAIAKAQKEADDLMAGAEARADKVIEEAESK